MSGLTPHRERMLRLLNRAGCLDFLDPASYWGGCALDQYNADRALDALERMGLVTKPEYTLTDAGRAALQALATNPESGK